MNIRMCCGATTGPEDLLELMEELHKVVGWYDVGIYLKVPTHILETIKEDHQSNNERKRAMFTWWLENTLEKKWSTIVLALSKTGYHFLASTIAFNHGRYWVSRPLLILVSLTSS